MVSHLASPWNRGLGQIGNGQLGKLYLPEMKECRPRGSPATNLMNAHFQQTLWTSLLFQGFNAIAKLQLNSYMFKWRWRNDRRSERNLCNCVKKPEKKNQDFNGVWSRDLAITGTMLYQLSYEATDVGSRSIVGSYVPVKEMSVNDIWNKPYMNCGNEMKMKKWSSQWTQFKTATCLKILSTSLASVQTSLLSGKIGKGAPLRFFLRGRGGGSVHCLVPYHLVG